jgi:hypothetical protein
MKRLKVPLPTEEEMNIARQQKLEVVALSARRQEQFLFLKLAYRGGGSVTVFLSPSEADYVARCLKGFLPKTEESDGSPGSWATEVVEAQFGSIPVHS